MTDKQKNKVSEIARLMGAPHPCDNGCHMTSHNVAGATQAEPL